MKRSSSAQNHFCTVAALLAGALISLCLSIGAGFRLLPIPVDEATSAPSGVSPSVQSSLASLLSEGATTRNGTTSVGQKRIKRQSQDQATLAPLCAHELSPNTCCWAVADQVQSLYSYHAVLLASGRGPPSSSNAR